MTNEPGSKYPIVDSISGEEVSRRWAEAQADKDSEWMEVIRKAEAEWNELVEKENERLDKVLPKRNIVTRVYDIEHTAYIEVPDAKDDEVN